MSTFASVHVPGGARLGEQSERSRRPGGPNARASPARPRAGARSPRRRRRLLRARRFAFDRFHAHVCGDDGRRQPLNGRLVALHLVDRGFEELRPRFLAERLNDVDTCDVNSRHHQAVKTVAAGFKVSATAPDGVIEAIEDPSLPFCLGVQWHPENFFRTGEFRPLFEGFVPAATR